MHRLVGTLLVVSCTAGCGYFASGTWDDDDRSWSRAFDSVKPPGVVVVHSRYSRFPHWTYEYEYYFHIAANPELLRQVFAKNQLVRLDAPDARLDRPPEAPAWFVPKGMRDYDAWRLAENPQSDFRLFVDRITGDVFITDQQL